ncbi:hypothetical protein Dimus_028507 [Dionaea muscipula]
MVDLGENRLEFEDMNNHKYPDAASSEESQVGELKRTCADCGTSKTPLWRGGPAGPKSLCNACGIRSRKKRRAVLGLNKGQAEAEEKRSSTTTKKKKKKKKKKKINHSNYPSNNNKFASPLHQRLLALGREVLMQRSKMDKQRRKQLCEEEQAAVLLMALSYGSVYS